MKSTQSLDKRGLIAGLAAYSLWGLFPLYFHNLEPASATEILAHRIVWSFALLVIVRTIRAARTAPLQWKAKSTRWCAFGGVLLSANWLIYVWAVNHDHVIEASLGYFINPLLTVAIGVVMFHERLSRLQGFALLIGGIASAAMTISSGTFPWISFGLAVTFGFYGFTKKKAGIDMVDSLFIETATVFAPAVVGLSWMLLGGTSTFTRHGGWLDLRLVLLGVVTVVPLLFFGAAANRVPLVWLGLLQYLTPWAQFLLGWWYFGESMPGTRLLAFGLIWISLGILVLDAIRQSRANGPRDQTERPVQPDPEGVGPGTESIPPPARQR